MDKLCCKAGENDPFGFPYIFLNFHAADHRAGQTRGCVWTRVAYIRETPRARAEGELKEKRRFAGDQCKTAGEFCYSSLNDDAEVVGCAACWTHTVLFTSQFGDTLVTVKSIQSVIQTFFILSPLRSGFVLAGRRHACFSSPHTVLG